MLRVRLLGGLALELDGSPLAAPRAAAGRSLLAWLALHPGPHPRGEIAAAFWPDVLDESARQSLRNALWTLRRDLGPAAPVLIADHDRLALDDGVDVDARRLAEALDRGEREVAATIAEAGELLRGFDDEWALAARDECRERVSTAVAALVDSAPDPAAGVAWARRRTRLDPFSEDATRVLMQRLAEAGEGAAALTVYERFADRLRRELRVAPGAATRALAEGLRTGAAAPVAVAPAAAPAPRRDPIPRALPLTGRSAELGVLVEEWSSVRAGTGGVVVVEGEPGIGKSRLTAELAAHAITDGGRAAVGAGIALEAAPPLAPWSEMLDALLEPGTETGAAWRDDLARLVPRLGSPAPAHSELSRLRLHEAVVGAVADAAARGPLLLVLEDAHLADDASLALLAHLGRRLRTLPALMVATRRPARAGALDTVEAHLQAAGALRTRIALGPLRPADAGALVRAAAGALDEDAVRRAVAAAEGNPLLAVESARALAAGHAGPPPSLLTTVRALLRGLPTDARGVADLLAVAGRALEPAEVDALPSADPVLAACDGLGCGLLTGGDGPLGYRHALLRDAAYAALEPPRRRSLHERVADALASVPGHRPAEIARHLRLAGRDARAVTHLARAAEQARDLAALGEARAFASEAIALRPDDPALWLLLAHVEALRGRHEDMLAASETGLALLPSGDAHARGLALLERGLWLSSALCFPAHAIRDFREADALLEGCGDLPGDRARLFAASAWAESVAGDPGRVEGLLAQATAICPPDLRGPIGVHAVSARVNARIRQDRAPEALELAADLEVATQRPGFVHRLGETVWLELSSVAAFVGDHDRALTFIERYLEVSGGLPSKRIEGLAGLAYVLVRLDRGDEAVAAAEEMVALADELGDEELPALARSDLGAVLCEVGDHERGVELIGRALADGAKVSVPQARLRRAESLVALGRLDEAAAELRETVLAPVRPLDQPETLVPRLARVQSLIAAARGDDDRAAALLDEAAAGWRRLGGLDRREAYMSNLVDLGRPPVAGLTEPARELARVEAERKEIPHALLR